MSIHVAITIIKNYSKLFPWFAAIPFKSFSVKVKNLQFAPTVISLVEIRLKLEVILHNMGIKWRMLHFFDSKKDKNRIWIGPNWKMEKLLGKLNKSNHWAFDPKWILNNIRLTTEHSYNVQNNLVLLGFTCLQIKISRNLKKS